MRRIHVLVPFLQINTSTDSFVILLFRFFATPTHTRLIHFRFRSSDR